MKNNKIEYNHAVLGIEAANVGLLLPTFAKGSFGHSGDRSGGEVAAQQTINVPCADLSFHGISWHKAAVQKGNCSSRTLANKSHSRVGETLGCFTQRLVLSLFADVFQGKVPQTDLMPGIMLQGDLQGLWAHCSYVRLPSASVAASADPKCHREVRSFRAPMCFCKQPSHALKLGFKGRDVSMMPKSQEPASDTNIKSQV